MNIDVLLEDTKLVNELDQIAEFYITHITDPRESFAEVLIMSDQVVHYNALSSYIMGTNKTYYYLVSDSLDPDLLRQIKTICESLNITMLPPKLTRKQIVKQVYQNLVPNVQDSFSNVVTFISTISNVGLTSTCLSVAASISSKTDAKVCVLGLDAWDDGVDQISTYSGKFLHEIKTHLTNRLLDKDTLISLFHKDDSLNFHYLAGNQNTKMERLYTIDEIDYLISLAKETFDLVIIDAGNHWDNANIFQSLHHADLKLLVLNQQRKCIKKFEQAYQHILLPLGYERSEFLSVINGYIKDPSLPSEKDIHSELNIPYLTTIPHLHFVGIHSEANQKILYNYEDEEYIQAINHICRGITSRTNLVIKDHPGVYKPKNKWSLLAKIGG